jgi:CDP-glycerol glycerophosphotransferase
MTSPSYSGIYFDFLLTDKPIFFYIPDEQEYLECDRDVYTTAEELSPLSPARDAMTLLDQITDYARLGAFDFSRLKEQKARFHYFSDGKNSERAFFAIKELR